VKLIRPITIDGASLSSSNVVETTPAAYNAGTTYALGDQVSVFSGINSTVATVYESLQAGNVGHTPSSSPSWWQPIGTAYLAWNSGTAYLVGAIVSDNTNHLLYESVQNGTNHVVTDTAYWVEIGPTNKWAMFDQKVGTLTTRPLEVSVDIDVTGRADTVALFNIDASAVNITVMDGVTEEYNEDYSLISDEGIIDWFEYYFEPVVRKTDLAVTDLPNVDNPTIVISATDGDDVSVGNCVVGLSREIGDTQYGASVGSTDYSRKTRDDFGNWYIVERGFNKNGRFQVMMEKANVDFVHSLLSLYRATPIVLLATDEYTSTYIYGLLKDWRIEISYPLNSVMSIEVEGL